MKNLKIGKKMFVTFGMIIAIFVLTVAVALVSLNNTINNFRDFYTIGYPVSVRTTEMRRGLRAALNALGNSMLTTDENKNQAYLEKVDKEMTEVAQGFEFLTSNFRGDLGLVQEAQAILEESKASRT